MTILVRALALSTNPPVYGGLVHIVPADRRENTPGQLHGRVEGREGVESLVEVQEMVICQSEPSLHQVSFLFLRFSMTEKSPLLTLDFYPLDTATPPRLPNPPLRTIPHLRRPLSVPSPPKSSRDTCRRSTSGFPSPNGSATQLSRTLWSSWRNALSPRQCGTTSSRIWRT